MEFITDFIAKYTGTETYKSLKYSCDSTISSGINYDDIKSDIVFEHNGEDEPIKKPKNLMRLAKSYETSSMFQYFLDGSRRTYKVDDIAINHKIYPIIAGQIGVGVCERKSPSKFSNTEIATHLVIVLPKILNDQGKGTEELYFNRLNDHLNQTAFLQKRKIKFSKTLFYESDPIGKDQDESDKYQKRGIAKIQDQMVNLEIELVKQLCKKGLLTDNQIDKGFLLKDGSLEYSEKGFDKTNTLHKLVNNYRKVVGVSKSFNLENLKDNKNHSLAVAISKLYISFQNYFGLKMNHFK